MTTRAATTSLLATAIAPRRAGLLALDAIAVFIAAATFLQGGEPDLLFHAIWVVLVIEAFVYGARVSASRIVMAAVLVVLYWLLEDVDGLAPLEVSDLPFSEWPLMFAIIAIVAVMADRVTRASRHLAALERKTHEELVTAREDERRRLASDLHDGLGQTLTALVLSLDATEASLEAEAPLRESSRDALRRVQHIAELALEETREVARQLRPARMREMGLTNAIRDLAAHAGREVEVTFDARLTEAGLLPVETEMQAYRIVQEAITNAVRHSSAATIHVDLQRLWGGRLQIEVHDDGDGFDMSRGTGDGIGLHGMRERAAAIGATLEVHSRVGAGTRVRLKVPPAPEASPG